MDWREEVAGARNYRWNLGDEGSSAKGKNMVVCHDTDSGWWTSYGDGNAAKGICLLGSFIDSVFRVRNNQRRHFTGNGLVEWMRWNVRVHVTMVKTYHYASIRFESHVRAHKSESEVREGQFLPHLPDVSPFLMPNVCVYVRFSKYRYVESNCWG